jgi:hypothetical protein
LKKKNKIGNTSRFPSLLPWLSQARRAAHPHALSLAHSLSRPSKARLDQLPFSPLFFIPASRGPAMAARRLPSGHDPDDEAPTKLPRASRPTQPTTLPRTHHLPANAMEGAPPGHGGTVAATHGAPLIQAGNDQNKRTESTSDSPR